MSINESNSNISDELLSAYLDGELSASEQASVEARLAKDPAARQMVEELRAVSEAVREIPRCDADANLHSAILQRIEQARVAPRQDQVSPRQESETEFTVGRSKRGWAWAAAAIAAALLVMVYQGQFAPEGQIEEVAQRADQSSPLQPAPSPETVPGFVNAPAPADSASGAGGGGGGIASSESTPDSSKELSFEAHSSTVMDLPDRRSGVAEEAPPLAPSSGPLVADRAVHASAARGRSAVPADIESVSGSGLRIGRAVTSRPIIVQLIMPEKSRVNRELENLLAEQQIVAMEDSFFLADESGAEINEAEELRVEAKQMELNKVEIINVEAPLNAIVSCLSSIEKDAQNFLKVEIQQPFVDDLASDATISKRAKSTDTSDTQAPATQWQRFNRGGPVPVQQRAFASDMRNNKRFQQSRSNEFRRQQRRKNNLAEGDSTRASDSSLADDTWQQVFFVIGSKPPEGPSPTQKARTN